MATKKKMTSREIAQLCFKMAEEKKAGDVTVLDVKGLSSVTDYFVICSGNSDKHVKAITEEIMSGQKKRGIPCWHEERDTGSTWIALDYFDVIVHVFLEGQRYHYNLEGLWGDAKRVKFTERVAGAPASAPKKKKAAAGKKTVAKSKTKAGKGKGRSAKGKAQSAKRKKSVARRA